jgi:hypothetical protein
MIAMTALQFHSILIRVVLVAVLGLVIPQRSDDQPMTKEEVTKAFNNLKKDKLTDTVKEAIARRGVDFELDAGTERDFRAAGMDQAFLDVVRRNAKITAVLVQCEPVECKVSINNNVAGTTESTLLNVTPVKPGLVIVEVSAPNFEKQTAEVHLSPGEHRKVPFVLPPLKGALNIKCVPAAVCAITVKGKDNGYSNSGEASQQQSFTVQGLPLGEYEVEAKAPPEYFPQTQAVWIPNSEVRNLTFELVEDPWGSKTPLQVFDAILGSLGGKDILSVAKYAKNTARMNLTGDPTSIGNWKEVQVSELAAPNRLRWDLAIAGSKWNVVFDGAKTGSNGDRKKYGGTPFAQELESSIRVFSTMRLPFVLSQILGKFDVKKGPNLVLVADSRDDRYTFFLNEDYSPLKLLHEHLTAPMSREEVEFGQYKSIGQDLKLPYVMILRYPERPRNEQVFQYEKIDPNVQMKEEYFRP